YCSEFSTARRTQEASGHNPGDYPATLNGQAGEKRANICSGKNHERPDTHSTGNRTPDSSNTIRAARSSAVRSLKTRQWRARLQWSERSQKMRIIASALLRGLLMERRLFRVAICK